MFLHMYFLQSVMEEEHPKGPSHNNPEETAKYVKDVNSLLQSFVTDIHGFDCYKRLDACLQFLQLVSRSTTFSFAFRTIFLQENRSTFMEDFYCVHVDRSARKHEFRV